MKTFKEFNSKNIPKFGIMTWKPKKHWQYWYYTFMLNIVPKRYKQYWFTKRCNFLNKPLLEVFSNSHYKKDFSTPIITEDMFKWEIITDKTK